MRPPELLVVDGVCAGGGSRPANDAACGWSDAAAWVVDGATSLDRSRLRSPTSARWMATTAASLLASLAFSPAPGARRLIAECAAGLADRWERARPASGGDLLPPAGSLAAAVLRPGGATVEMAAVGDCAVVLRRPGGTAQVVTDLALAAAGAEYAEAERARSGTLKSPDATRGAPAANRVGYIAGEKAWIMGGDPAAPGAAAEVEVVEAAADRGSALLLATDGFTRAVRLKRFAGSWDGLLAACEAEGLSAVLAELRAAERDDPDFAAGEYKASDDAAALLVRVA